MATQLIVNRKHWALFLSVVLMLAPMLPYVSVQSLDVAPMDSHHSMAMNHIHAEMQHCDTQQKSTFNKCVHCDNGGAANSCSCVDQSNPTQINLHVGHFAFVSVAVDTLNQFISPIPPSPFSLFEKPPRYLAA